MGRQEFRGWLCLRASFAIALSLVVAACSGGSTGSNGTASPTAVSVG